MCAATSKRDVLIVCCMYRVVCLGGRPPHCGHVRQNPFDVLNRGGLHALTSHCSHLTLWPQAAEVHRLDKMGFRLKCDLLACKGAFDELSEKLLDTQIELREVKGQVGNALSESAACKASEERKDKRLKDALEQVKNLLGCVFILCSVCCRIQSVVCLLSAPVHVSSGEKAGGAQIVEQ